MKITNKQRIDWIERISKERVVSFHHPTGKGYAHVRAAIDKEIRKEQKSVSAKPKTKTTK